jgi:DNA-binding beta-propeller fold protein YncE
VTLYNVGVIRVVDATYLKESRQVGIAGVGGVRYSARGITLTPDGTRAYVASARNGEIIFPGGKAVSVVVSGSVCRRFRFSSWYRTHHLH